VLVTLVFRGGRKQCAPLSAGHEGHANYEGCRHRFSRTMPIASLSTLAVPFYIRVSSVTKSVVDLLVYGIFAVDIGKETQRKRGLIDCSVGSFEHIRASWGSNIKSVEAI
jgi:hypothetical protein